MAPSLYFFAGTYKKISSCSTSSGMAAIMTAVQPFLPVLTKAGEPRNVVATAQCYVGTFQQLSNRWRNCSPSSIKSTDRGMAALNSFLVVGANRFW